MDLYHYGNNFFAYQQIGSLTSARTVAPIVLRHLRPISVLDVGCGAGAWVAAYVEAGARHVTGVDGPYVRRDQLLFDPARFESVDVASPFRLGRRYDLVQCLEVAEHLSPAASETLVDNLVAHAPIVLFSAAPPGQGGENHVNERPYSHWRDLFAARGYSLFDFIRPQIQHRAQVECWYRYNMLLFVRDDAIARLSGEIAATRIAPGLPVPDLAPAGWRARRAVLSLLPPRTVTWMASVKHRIVLGTHSRGRAS
jgi:SAM-dependent methyltransferase